MLAETPALYQVMTEVMGEKLDERRDFLFYCAGVSARGVGGNFSGIAVADEGQPIISSLENGQDPNQSGVVTGKFA